MMTGNIERGHLIQRLLEGRILNYDFYCFYHAFCSYLNSLVPMFNKVTREHLIDNLRSRADGETVVDMLTEFNTTTLQVISMVSE